MGTRQFTWQTDLDYENTFRKLQEAEKEGMDFGKVRPHQEGGEHGNIRFNLPKCKAKVQISPEGKVNIWLPSHMSLPDVLNVVKPLCLKEDGKPCEWDFPKVNPGPAVWKEAVMAGVPKGVETRFWGIMTYDEWHREMVELTKRRSKKR